MNAERVKRNGGSRKLLVAGVGGQGVVYLTNLIVEAALLADLWVASSEIHGLAQRGGSVVAGITFGDDTYGFIERGGADFLIGLEPLEAQRCLPYLNAQSSVVIDNRRVLPYSVNAGKESYPDSQSFFEYLRKHARLVIVIEESDESLSPTVRNIHALGGASTLDGFPIPCGCIEKAIEKLAKAGYKQQNLEAFRLGRTHDKK
jgi:indolepyruvate ferredoxin oxidoreductase beta subunit